MVVVGYQLDRAITMAAYGIVGVLFGLQSLSICVKRIHDKPLTIRWTVHRVGAFAALCGMLSQIDRYRVFGIYTDSNRLDVFFFQLANCLGATMIFSFSYSVMLSNATITNGPMPLYFRAGLSALTIVVLFACTILPVNWIIDRNPTFRSLQIAGIIILSICLVLTWVAACDLRSKLKATLQQGIIVYAENPEARLGPQHALRSLNRFTLFFTLVLLGVIMLQSISLSGRYNTRDDNGVFHNPESFTGVLVYGNVVLIIGYLMLIWLTWIPVTATCRGGTPVLHFSTDSHHSVHRGTQERGAPSDGSTSGRPHQGGAASGSTATGRPASGSTATGRPASGSTARNIHIPRASNARTNSNAGSSALASPTAGSKDSAVLTIVEEEPIPSVDVVFSSSPDSSTAAALRANVSVNGAATPPTPSSPSATEETSLSVVPPHDENRQSSYPTSE